MDYNIDYNNVEKDRTLLLQEKINRYLKKLFYEVGEHLKVLASQWQRPLLYSLT